MEVSRNGDFIWGIHLTEYPKGKVLRQCFSTGESLLYDYEHEKAALSLLVVKDLKTVISGGSDNKAVLHDLDSGKTTKIIDLQYGYLSCLFRLGNVVGIGDKDRITFLDVLNKKYMNVIHVKLGGGAYCMLIRGGKSKGGNVELLVGNQSQKLKQIILVNKLVKEIGVIGNIKAPVREKIIKKMIKKTKSKPTYEQLVVEIESLKDKNQLLRAQNESLKSRLSELETKTIKNLVKRQADLEKKLKSAKSRKKEYKREFTNITQELEQEKEKNMKLVKARMNNK
jgi:hypothetical protein